MTTCFCIYMTTVFLYLRFIADSRNFSTISQREYQWFSWITKRKGNNTFHPLILSRFKLISFNFHLGLWPQMERRFICLIQKDHCHHQPIQNFKFCPKMIMIGSLEDEITITSSYCPGQILNWNLSRQPTPV